MFCASQGPLAPRANAAGPELTTAEYANARDLAIEIMTKFPPEKYFYLGIGRSPFPVTALIEALRRGSTGTLPLSNVRSEGAVGFEIFDTFVPWNAYREELFAHFDRFVPSSLTLGNRKILMIDLAVSSGSGLTGAHGMLKAYLSERCWGCAVEGLALNYWYPRSTAGARVRQAGHEVIILNDRYPALAEALAYEKYKDYAPYGSYLPQITLGVEPNEAYFEFERKLLERLRADTADCLKGFLRLVLPAPGSPSK